MRTAEQIVKEDIKDIRKKLIGIENDIEDLIDYAVENNIENSDVNMLKEIFRYLEGFGL